MPAVYNLVVPQATTFEFQFQPQTDGVPWNLTGYTATMTVRPFLGATTTTLVATTEDGRITIDPIAATVTVNLSVADTTLKAEPYVYDLMLYSGETIRLLEGKFLVTAGVTV